LFSIPQNNNPHNTIYIVILPRTLCGFAYCFFSASLWPSIPYVVDKKLLGSAYGVITSLQNIGLVLGPFIASLVVNNDEQGGNYRMLNFIQSIEAIIGLGFGIAFWIYSSKKRGDALIDNSDTKDDELDKEKVIS